MPRHEHEPPVATAEWGWRYHHLGIPTEQPREGEVYLESYGMYVSGFGTSPYGVEWMRFEPNSPVSELVRTVPHIAFEVDDLDAVLLHLRGRIFDVPARAPVTRGVGGQLEVFVLVTAEGARPFLHRPKALSPRTPSPSVTDDDADDAGGGVPGVLRAHAVVEVLVLQDPVAHRGQGHDEAGCFFRFGPLRHCRLRTLAVTHLI